MKFHNPYHFVPVSAKNGSDTVSVSDFKAAQTPGHLTHDRYVPDTGTASAKQAVYSGRVVCRLVTESPLVIGAQQARTDGDPDEVTVVSPFLVNGQPAIPGSSLRGLVSSVAEAVSNSALRVLDNSKGYSFRRGMSEGLSALGMVVVSGKDEQQPKYRLQPLTMPHLKSPSRGGEFDLGHALPEGARSQGFSREMFPAPALKCYLGDSRDIRNPEFQRKHPTYQITNVGAGPFFGLKLAATPPLRRWSGSGRLRQDQRWQHIKHGILLAQLADQPDLLPWPEAPADQAEKLRQGYVRGILRTLGVTPAREKFLPTKKHEYFIPYAAEMETDFNRPPEPGHWREYPILPEAVERFHKLADERADVENTKKTHPDEALPFHPIGTSRGAGPKSQPPHSFRLKSGDIVFFRPTQDGQAIAEIALSSIWRGQVITVLGDDLAPAALPADFFAALNPDLLPLGAEANGAEANPSLRKQHLTLAELLFGFVEQRPRTRGARPANGEAALAFASRLRPSPFALPESPAKPGDWWHRETGPSAPPGLHSQDEQQQWFTLKILASPKPPSPAMYFHPRSGPGYIAKKNLAPGTHVPNGRKYYLPYAGGTDAFQTHPANRNDLRKQKAHVRPLRSGLSFWFHFDFENLSQTELELLCYALQPAEAYRHKLGLGKPLGLGLVRIEPAGLFLINRLDRYGRDALKAPRYARMWTNPKTPAWPPQYERENLERERSPSRVEPPEFFGRLRSACRSRMHTLFPQIVETLENLGNPSVLEHSVHYPQVEGVEGKELEEKTYAWFMGNDDQDGQRQTLSGTRPPALDRQATRHFFFVHRRSREARAIEHLLARHAPGRVKWIEPSTPPDSQRIVDQLRQREGSGDVLVLVGFEEKPPPTFPRLKVPVRFTRSPNQVAQIRRLLKLPEPG